MEGSTAFPFSTGLGHFSPPGQTPPRSTGTGCPHTFGPICSCGASEPQYGETGPLLPMAGWARQAVAGVCAADLRSMRCPPWMRLGRPGSDPARGAVGTSTPAAPSDGLCLRVLFGLRECSLNFIFRQYLKSQNPDSQLLLDRTDHSDLSGSRRVLL